MRHAAVLEQADTGNTYRREREEHTRLCAFPFSSELKHMTTVSNVDGRILSYVKGSPECVLDMCALQPDRLAELCRVLVQAEEQAMRVIAFAHKELAEMEDFSAKEAHRRMESDMVFDGFVAIADPLRSDVYDAVAACRSAGVGVKILTGDNIVTATAIAKELDLLADGCVALEAKEVEEMSDRRLQKMLPKISVIARSTPTVKMRVVKLLKARGDVVAVTGDGINDAPALKNADVGDRHGHFRHGGVQGSQRYCAVGRLLCHHR